MLKAKKALLLKMCTELCTIYDDWWAQFSTFPPPPSSQAGYHFNIYQVEKHKSFPAWSFQVLHAPWWISPAGKLVDAACRALPAEGQGSDPLWVKLSHSPATSVHGAHSRCSCSSRQPSSETTRNSVDLSSWPLSAALPCCNTATASPTPVLPSPTSTASIS